MIKLCIIFIIHISTIFGYTIPFSMNKMLIIGCGNLGKDVALHMKNIGVHVTATTTNINKIANIKNYVNDIIFIPNETKKFEDTIKNVDSIFISVAPTNTNQTYKNVYIDTVNNIVDILGDISKPIHITFVSSVSAYGTITNGDKIDETYNKKVELNDNAKILRNAETILLDFQKKNNNIKVSIFRPQVLWSKKNNALSLVKWASGKSLSKQFGEIYMGVSHHEEIINAYKFCLQEDIQGIININNPIPIKRKDFFHIICEKYEIPNVKWLDNVQNISLSYIGGNKEIISKKLQDNGYKFIISDVKQKILEEIEEIKELYGYLPLIDL